MTNEELAVRIQNGHTELYADLWTQVCKIVKIKAERYSRKLHENGRRMDPEDFVDDLVQAGYFAVVAAVKYYDQSEEWKFTTYLDRTLKTAFRQAAGARTSKRDPLDAALYLDAPCGEDDEETMLAFVADLSGDMEQIDESVYIWELREALDDALSILTDREREVLTLRYLLGVNYSVQAENRGVSRNGIALVAKEAFEKIRRNRHIMTKLAEFMPQYDYDPFRFTGYGSWRNTNLSVQDRYLRDQETREDEAWSFLL